MKLFALDILDTIVIIDIPSIKVKANSYLRVTFEKVDQSSLFAESQPGVSELHRASLQLSLVKQCMLTWCFFPVITDFRRQRWPSTYHTARWLYIRPSAIHSKLSEALGLVGGLHDEARKPVPC